jgi:hypothetical protein
MSTKLLHLGWLVWLGSCTSSGETAVVDAATGATGGSGGASGPDAQLDARASGADGSVLTDGGSCHWPQAANVQRGQRFGLYAAVGVLDLRGAERRFNGSGRSCLRA